MKEYNILTSIPLQKLNTKKWREHIRIFSLQKITHAKVYKMEKNAEQG